MLGVLAGLVLVEERHDLAHHRAHRIVAQILGDGNQTDAVLGQLADVELELELIPEKTREAVHHDHVESGRLGQGAFDHGLEGRATIIRRGVARFHILRRRLPPFGLAVDLKPTPLVGNREIALSLTAS
ncbi:hypothetical protein D3C85_1580360 [compost metagenome]